MTQHPLSHPDTGERDPLEAFDAKRRPATRALLRLVGHHPELLPEYVVVFAVQRLAPEIRAWVKRHGAVPGSHEYEDLLDALRHDSIGFARLNGALAGTPLFIALVPAYVSVLWQQARMALRIAALNGKDPGAPERAAELLVISGVYPSVEPAAAALTGVSFAEPQRGKRLRGFVRAVGGLHAWVELVKQVLTLAGFLESSRDKPKPSRARQIASVAIGVAVWVLTWIVPLAFMLVMGWNCERRTREVFDRSLAAYGAAGDAGAWRRAMARWRRQRPLRYLAVLVAVAVPFSVIGYAVETKASGTSWLRILAVLLGLVTTLILTGIVNRRQ